MNNPEHLFAKGIASLGVTADPDAVAGLIRYYHELVRWNRSINLVGKAPPEEIIERHFVDSLTLLSIMDCPNLPHGLLDVGTGGGFPGLVLKVVLPGLPVTLVEPRLKRVSFLKHIIRTLKLSGVEVLPVRLSPTEAVPELQGKRFSLITSRALMTVQDFLNLAVPVSRQGDLVVCMKGRKAEEELAIWRQAPSPYEFLENHPAVLPFSTTTRNLLLFRRTA